MEREYLKEFVCSETIIPSENEEIKKEKFIKKNSWKIELKFSDEEQKKRKVGREGKFLLLHYPDIECSKFSKEGQTKATRDKEKKKERKEKKIRKKRKWVQRSRVD